MTPADNLVRYGTPYVSTAAAAACPTGEQPLPSVRSLRARDSAWAACAPL